VKVLCDQRFGRPPAFLPFTVGIGAGTKDFDKHPNILRVVLGKLTAATSSSNSGSSVTSSNNATAAANVVAVQHSSSADAAKATALPDVGSLTINDNSSAKATSATSISSGDTTASTAVRAYAHSIPNCAF
jgi:uncharacterized protein (DUF111 family)